MIFSPEMTRDDARLVATSSDREGTNVVANLMASTHEVKATLVAYREERFWKGIMNNRVGVCG